MPTRNLACSYAQTTKVPSRQLLRSTASPNADTSVHSGLQLSSNTSGLDVGTGTPAELLREAELTQTLLSLYFQNFNDIHFMFDQTIFLRRYVLGDIPKVLLFAIMALGIRYSHAPFQSPRLRPHWGEPLYNEARQLLKEDFDHPSPTTIQVYVLLATYNLTFGGARKAWIFLSFARSFVSILKLDQPASDTDPVQAELCRRLVATVALMEHTFPSGLNMGRPFPPVHTLPRLYAEEEFDVIKNPAFAAANLHPMPCIAQEILTLSEYYHQACQIFDTPTPQGLEALEQRLSQWQASLDESLVFNRENLEVHLQKFAVRPFAYMHLLYAHIWQLALFDSMDWTSATIATASEAGKRILPIYKQASNITGIVHQLWEVAQLDLHNNCFGQIAKTAQIILAHQLLSTTDAQTMACLQTELLILRDCLIRVKAHCRLYNWVFDQAEWFLRICTQDSFLQGLHAWKSVVRFQVMSLGTCYERLDYETATD
ncbi:fungal specific transcription factor domain-containing protein [Aspergillus mulundensis]|uniref:Xylanolytic transcriptional activator regulatory domain-containing protein n=1 Tax=Aspergillus mulundensis TaxID=1810919 RepID=A0A3D8RKI4_9EURO|nr:Uncharacterized protein DSM5745_07205 [Aspergillus mulundensis]RDW74543.1 Uncharacterized protein DSM5745_07205 [Aspergillus mulundensis]